MIILKVIFDVRTLRETKPFLPSASARTHQSDYDPSKTESPCRRVPPLLLLLLLLVAPALAPFPLPPGLLQQSLVLQLLVHHAVLVLYFATGPAVGEPARTGGLWTLQGRISKGKFNFWAITVVHSPLRLRIRCFGACFFRSRWRRLRFLRRFRRWRRSKERIRSRRC